MVDSTTAENSPESMKVGAFSSFLNLEFGRQLGLMLGLALSVAIGVSIALWVMVDKDYKPLYSSLDQMDVNSIFEILESHNIEHKIDNKSGALLVDSSDIHRARLLLASSGMTNDRNFGYELLDKDQPLGTSQFMETTRYRRSLEGELARTISSIASVRSARVHLALPKNTIFLRDKREPRASIFIETFQGRKIEDYQVRAVANLVVSSVPELSLSDVTVVDQKGNLLSDFDGSPKYAEAARQIEYTRQVETDLLNRVNSILIPILGEGKFTAEVSIDLDFTQVEQTAEKYNPDIPVIRSEQTTIEKTIKEEKSIGIPGALSNQPPMSVSNSSSEKNFDTEDTILPSQSRTLETRNYEIDRTISYTKNAVGGIRRLSVAVAIDDANSDSIENTSWSSEKLNSLTLLVQNTVGFDASRGDTVIVINTPFINVDNEILTQRKLMLWEYDIFWVAMKWLLGILGFLIIIFFILRPTMQRLSDTSSSKRNKKFDINNDLKNSKSEISQGDISSSMEKMDNLDEQINMVKKMVAENPDRVAQVIQGWSGND